MDSVSAEGSKLNSHHSLYEPSAPVILILEPLFHGGDISGFSGLQKWYCLCWILNLCTCFVIATAWCLFAFEIVIQWHQTKSIVGNLSILD